MWEGEAPAEFENAWRTRLSRDFALPTTLPRHESLPAATDTHDEAGVQIPLPPITARQLFGLWMLIAVLPTMTVVSLFVL